MTMRREGLNTSLIKPPSDDVHGLCDVSKTCALRLPANATSWRAQLGRLGPQKSRRTYLTHVALSPTHPANILNVYMQ